MSLATLRVGLSLLFFFGRRDLSLFIHLFHFFSCLFEKPLPFGRRLVHFHFDNSSPSSYLLLVSSLFPALSALFSSVRPSSSRSLILRIGNCHRLATGVRIPDRFTLFLINAWCILRRWGSHRSPSDFNILIIEIKIV